MHWLSIFHYRVRRYRFFSFYISTRHLAPFFQDESSPARSPLRLRIRARRAEGAHYPQDLDRPAAACLDREGEGEPDAAPRHAD